MGKLASSVMVIAVVVLGACGSRADHSELEVAVPPGEEGAGGEGAQAGGEGEATTTTVNAQEATSEITQLVEEGINGANLGDVEAGVEKVEDGESVRDVIEEVAANPAFKTATSKVKRVEVLDEAGCEGAAVDPPCAQTTFDIFLNNAPTPALPDYIGYAVLRDDAWVISKTSFCDLVGLAGLVCPT
jgi:hypothetical protein